MFIAKQFIILALEPNKKGYSLQQIVFTIIMHK